MLPVGAFKRPASRWSPSYMYIVKQGHVSEPGIHLFGARGSVQFASFNLTCTFIKAFLCTRTA